MNSSLIQLLVLAGIAVFLILRLKNVLGTREGYEKSARAEIPEGDTAHRRKRVEFEVIEGGPDRDIVDHVEEGSSSAQALQAMKDIEPDFSIADFLQGARGAYEMIVMNFERGEIDNLKGYLADDIYAAFEDVIAERAEKGLTIEAEFIGIRELKLVGASYDEDTQEAEISVRYVAELTSAVRNATGEIVEGSPTEIKKQKDVWSFSRYMGSDNPNWILVSTDA